MKLIDADAIYKILESCEIRKATIGNPLTDWEYGYTCGIERAESEIECAPTVDAVPVIRCKDCKWFGDIGCAISIVDDTDKPSENDYCSWAERRNDETD